MNRTCMVMPTDVHVDEFIRHHYLRDDVPFLFRDMLAHVIMNEWACVPWVLLMQGTL